MKKFKILLASAMLLSLTACSQPSIQLNDEYKNLKDSVVVEYGEMPSLEASTYLMEDTSEEILKDTELTIHAVSEEKTNEEAIDTSAEDYILPVGDYKIQLAYNDDLLEVPVKVQDTVAPEFKDFTETLSYEQGTEGVDLASLFTAEDLAETTITVEGEVDYNTPGEYKVKVVATDASDNKTEKECTITITAKPVASTGGSSGSGSSSRPSSGGSTSSGSASSNTSSGSSSSGGSSSSSGSSGGNTYVPEPSGYKTDFSQEIFNLINQERVNNGLNELSYANDLQWLANERAKEIIIDFSHDGLINRYGYTYGENCGKGYSSPQQMMNGWMNSSGHRGAILRETYVRMVTSCYFDSDTNTLYWVVIFAKS